MTHTKKYYDRQLEQWIIAHKQCDIPNYVFNSLCRNGYYDAHTKDLKWRKIEYDVQNGEMAHAGGMGESSINQLRVFLSINVPNKVEVICRNCHYWEPHSTDIPEDADWEGEYSDTLGHCFRYPPVYIARDIKNDFHFIFPDSYQSDWCGEFKKKEEE